MRILSSLPSRRIATYLTAIVIVLGTLLALILLQPAQVASADTPVCGNITTNTNWVAAKSPYIVTCDVIVANGVTLKIEPNVSVKFDQGASLQVNGTLIAEECTLTTNDPTPARGDWGHVLFTATTKDASFDATGDYVSGSKIEGCLVEWGGGGEGVNGAIEVDGASPFIHLNTIRQNGSSGIHATGRSSSKPVNLKENNVNNNSGSTAGGGIYIANGQATGNTIANNSIDAHDGGGIHAVNSTLEENVIVDNEAITSFAGVARGGGIYATGSTLLNNTVSSNRTSARDGGSGGGIYASGCTVKGNTVSGNSAVRGVGGPIDGGGIYADGGIVEGNIVHDNTIFSGSNFRPTVRGGGIYASLGTITGNDVANNTINSNGEAHGGGIYAAGSTTSGNEVTGNSANAAATYTGFGGGIYAQGGSVQENTVRMNSTTGSEGWGGGIYNEGGNVQENEIEANNGTLGGAVYSEQGSVTANVVLKNTTQITGTVYMAGGTAASNTLTGNRASYGGGLFGDGANLVGNTIQNNEATVAGGGLYAVSGTVNGNEVNQNETLNNGGGVYASGGTFSGNTISGNIAPTWGHGSGAYLAGTVEFTSNNVTNQVISGGAVGGVAIEGQPKIHLNNIFGNEPYDAEVVSAASVDARNNYWGPSTCTAISGQIYDGNDVPGRGKLTYAPSLYSPVPLAQLESPADLVVDRQELTTARLDWTAIADLPNIGCRVPGSREPDIGYLIYYDTKGNCTFDGTGLAEGDSPIDAGTLTSFELTGLTVSRDYYFTVAAYDYLDRISPYADQVKGVGEGGSPIFLPFVSRGA